MTTDGWHAGATGIPMSRNDAARSLIDVQQDPTGTKVVQIYRVWHYMAANFNAGPGNLFTFRIARLGGCWVQNGNVSMRPVRNNSISATPPVTAGTGRGYSENGLLRTYVRSTQNAIIGNNPDTIERWEMDVPMCVVWDAGYTSFFVQPVTLRASEGFHVRQTATSISTNMHNFDVELTIT